MVLKSVIFASALAAAALAAPLPTSTRPSVPTGTHTPQDPCAALAALEEPSVLHVKACYESIPYNVQNNDRIKQSLPFFYEQFWAYKGAALISDLGAPFDYKPVDIFAEFQRVGNTQYPNDYAFHEAMRLAINKLQDAHSSYDINCYMSYIFRQPIVLYAPVVDGVQSVRVLFDDTNNRLEECTVDAIEGQEPFTYLHNWAIEETGYSKDPAVRLNAALGSMGYMVAGEYGPDYGSFAQRTSLPSSPTVSYTVTCQSPQGPTTHNLNLTWSVNLSNLWQPFRDSESFYRNCLATVKPAATQGTNKELVADEEMLEEFVVKQRQQPHKYKRYVRALAAAPEMPELRKPPMENATLVATTAHTAMYQLQNRPDVGVVVVPTMDIAHTNHTEGEYALILQGLTALADLNVTRIILELSNNGGGYVDFAGSLISWFFPKATNAQISNPGDFRVTTEIQRISTLLFTHNVKTLLYSPGSYIDPTTHHQFQDNFFTTPVTTTRGGLQDTYTTKLLDMFNPGQDIPRFPWSDDATRIKILTDGRCGSSCTLSASVMIHTYGVESYATGGYAGKPISAFSFAGGTIQNWQDVYELYYNRLEMGQFVPNFTAPPLNGTYNVATYEVYVGNDALPLDYTPARFPAKYQINLAPDTARHPDRIWSNVANHAWPTQTGA